jgi:hypothetical protein
MAGGLVTRDRDMRIASGKADIYDMAPFYSCMSCCCIMCMVMMYMLATGKASKQNVTSFGSSAFAALSNL